MPDSTGKEVAPYVLEERRSHFSWGAEHVVAEIVFWISNTIVGGIAYDALKGLVSDLLDNRQLESGPLERQEAEGIAAWTLSERYSVDDGSLELVEERTEPVGAFFAYRSGSWRYEVTIQSESGYATVARVRRLRFPA